MFSGPLQTRDQGTPKDSFYKYSNQCKYTENSNFPNVKIGNWGIGQRFDPAYLHQTNHKVKALWFELFKEKLRNRIPRKGAGSASSKALPAPFFVFCLAYDQPESQLSMDGIHIDGAQVPNTEQRREKKLKRFYILTKKKVQLI